MTWAEDSRGTLDVDEGEADVNAGQIALITGAARGIGRNVALSLAAAGYTVGIHDRDREPLSLVAEEIGALGGTARILVADIDQPSECARIVKELEETDGHIDALVSNAGQAASGRSLAGTSADEVEALLRTHVVGAFCVIQAALPGMRARGRGSVVAVSSATTQLLPARSGPYSMAKSALDALVLTLAKEEAARGIRANVVAPSLVDTRLGQLVKERLEVGLQRTGVDVALPTIPTKAVADAVTFLLSDQASHISGQRLVIDHFVTAGVELQPIS